MNTIGSVATIALVLAAIFVPQILAIYFGERSNHSEQDEYIPDGR